MTKSGTHLQRAKSEPCSGFFREVHLDNQWQALSYTTACLSTKSSQHGLFCMKSGNSGKYQILLSSLEEVLFHGHCEYDLSIGPGVTGTGDKGLGYISEMASSPWPAVWFSVGMVTFRKELILSEYAPELHIRYTLEEGACSSEFLIRPLLAFRQSTYLNHYDGYTPFITKSNSRSQVQVKVHDPGFQRLWLTCSGESTFMDAPEWRFNIKYKKNENEHELSSEDLFSPGIFHCQLKQYESIIFSVATEQVLHTVPITNKFAMMAF